MAGTCRLCLPGPQLPHLQKEGPDWRPWEAHPTCAPSLSFQACPQQIGPFAHVYAPLPVSPSTPPSDALAFSPLRPLAPWAENQS